MTPNQIRETIKDIGWDKVCKVSLADCEAFKVPMWIKRTAKHTAKTTDGQFRKTKIINGTEMRLDNWYMGKSGRVILTFKRTDGHQIEDTYAGKQRLFDHIEIPIEQIKEEFSTESEIEMFRRLGLGIEAMLKRANITLEKARAEAEEVRAAQYTGEGAGLYGAFS